MKRKDRLATNLKIKVIDNVVNDSNTTLERKREMTQNKRTVCLLALLGVLGWVQSAPAQNKPGKKIYAQKLVDETLAKHPEVVILAFHVTPPKSQENVIIASNIGRIGKKADEDDLRVIRTGKPNLEVNAAGDHFEVELVLQDQGGKTIGCAGVVFPYKPGTDKAKLQRTAELIRDEIRQQTPNREKLFEPVQ
jgi:iron complex outermembrane receptor protein